MVNEIFFEAKKKQLYKVITGSMEQVPFYRDHWKFPLVSDQEFDYQFFITHIPLLEKKDLMRDTELFISDAFKEEELDLEATSGTEGKPMVCYKSKEERMRCSLDLWSKRRSWVRDLSPQNRFARFYAFRLADQKSLITNTILYKDKDIHIPLFDMSEDKLSTYWEKILEFQPRWMHGPSTAVFNIAKYVKEKHLPKCPIEFVELNGEFAPTEHIQLIREVWGCKVANNYGCREFWTLAYSCPENKLHIVDNSVFIENLNNPDLGSSEILITSLRNLAWPLIRYRIGDIGEVRLDERCACGTNSRFSLDLKRGRKADYFTMRNGQTINAILFSGVARGLGTLEGHPLIYQYQVHKKSDNLLDIKLCVNESAGQAAKEIIQRYDAELRKIIHEEIMLHYEVVDFIPTDPRTGKCKDFIDLSR